MKTVPVSPIPSSATLGSALALAAAGCWGPAPPAADPFAGRRAAVFYTTAWVDAGAVAGVVPDGDGVLWNPARLPAVDVTVANLTGAPVEVREPLLPGPRDRPHLIVSEFGWEEPPGLAPDGTLTDGLPGEDRSYLGDRFRDPPPGEEEYDGRVRATHFLSDLLTDAGRAAARAAEDAPRWTTIPPGGRLTRRVPLGELFEIELSGPPRTVSFGLTPAVRDDAGRRVDAFPADGGTWVATFADPRRSSSSG